MSADNSPGREESPESPDVSHAAFDPSLLEILRCPLSHARLELVEGRLVCYDSGKAYRIEDGIPVLLVEEAEDLTDAERAAGSQRPSTNPS